METLVRVVVGGLLVAHGLVHLLYLVPDAADPRYPFTLEESWLLPEPARRPVAVTLVVAVVITFTLLGLAVWGVPGLSSAWPAIAIGAAAMSLALLVAFWDVRLLFGVLIDVAIIVIAVVRPGWTDRI